MQQTEQEYPEMLVHVLTFLRGVLNHMHTHLCMKSIRQTINVTVLDLHSCCPYSAAGAFSATKHVKYQAQT